jgi:hypothetical protein
VFFLIFFIFHFFLSYVSFTPFSFFFIFLVLLLFIKSCFFHDFYSVPYDLNFLSSSANVLFQTVYFCYDRSPDLFLVCLISISIILFCFLEAIYILVPGVDVICFLDAISLLLE